MEKFMDICRVWRELGGLRYCNIELYFILNPPTT